MYSIPNFNQALSNKTFYKADHVQMFWNDLGTNLLVLTQTDVDKTGKSYYGGELYRVCSLITSSSDSPVFCLRNKFVLSCSGWKFRLPRTPR